MHFSTQENHFGQFLPKEICILELRINILQASKWFNVFLKKKYQLGLFLWQVVCILGLGILILLTQHPKILQILNLREVLLWQD